ILRSRAASRHIVLLSDGVSEPHDYQPLIARLRQTHVSVSTVALGHGADRALLSRLARGTHGREYYTADAGDLPRIFADDARRSAQPVRLRGRIAVQPGASSPVVASLLGQRLPQLAGNVVTDLKPTATAALLADGGREELNPVLAQWQYGL